MSDSPLSSDEEVLVLSLAVKCEEEERTKRTIWVHDICASHPPHTIIPEIKGTNKSQAVLYYHDRSYLTGEKDTIFLNSNEESISKEKFDQLNTAWRLKLNSEGLRNNDVIIALDCYASEHPEVTIKTHKSGERFSIALVTEFMKKCHTAFEEVEKLCYVETARHYNTISTIVTVFLAASSAGAIPLGIIFCSDEEVDSYIKGFQLLKEAIGPVAFNEKHYPETFVINDCDATKEALQKTWPNSSQFLCSYRLLHSMLPMLCGPRSQITKEDQQKLVKTMKQLIWSKTTKEFRNNYKILMSGELSCYRYGKFIVHVRMLAKRKEEWCHAYQEKQIDKELSAICELTSRVFKHIAMVRCKIYKTAAFIMYMSEIFSGYLQQRLLDRALEEDEKLFSKQTIDKFDFTNNGDNTFTLRNKREDTNYKVDLSVGSCSCPTKYPNAPCDHEVACAEVVSIGLPASVEGSEEIRKKISKVIFRVEDPSSHTKYIQNQEEYDETSVKIEPCEEVVVKHEEITDDYTEDLYTPLSLKTEEFPLAVDNQLEAIVDPVTPSKRSRKRKVPIQFEKLDVQEEGGDVGQIMMEDIRNYPPSTSGLETDAVPCKKLCLKYPKKVKDIPKVQEMLPLSQISMDSADSIVHWSHELSIPTLEALKEENLNRFEMFIIRVARQLSSLDEHSFHQAKAKIDEVISKAISGEYQRQDLNGIELP